MPVLEPNPPDPQIRLLLILGAMLAIGLVISVIAILVSP
jgi:hypothetical protein